MSLEQRVPVIRLTGILVEGNDVLIQKQCLREKSNWAFPGGCLEFGETVEQCLIREMAEETSLDVRVGNLLYVCDRFKGLGRHVVDMSFEVFRVAGELPQGRHVDSEGETISSFAMVPIKSLADYGFSGNLTEIILRGFPGKGSYQGDFHRFYGAAKV